MTAQGQEEKKRGLVDAWGKGEEKRDAWGKADSQWMYYKRYLSLASALSNSKVIPKKILSIKEKQSK